MRRISLGVTVVVAALVVFFLSESVSSQGRRIGRLEVEEIGAREAVAREILVKFKELPQPATIGQLAAEADAEVVQRVGRGGVLRVVSRSRSAAALLAALAQRPDVAFAEPNYVVHTMSEPGDPLFPQLWGLKNIGQPVNGGAPGTVGADIRAAEAWDLTVGSTSNVVAVIDTGIDYTHSDLAPNMWSAPAPFTVNIRGVNITCQAGTHGFNAITKTCDPMDDHNHGTHVAGTIGAVGNNAAGVVGVNWLTSLMGLKFLDSSGSGTTADAIDAIDFAMQVKQIFAASGGANIRILSNSWGGGDFSQALLDAINEAADDDMLFVAAAGNNGLPNDWIPMYPASYAAANIIAVAATTNTDARAFFSNYGAKTVHLGAPGADILSTLRGGTYGFQSGTSMATPHVSGAAALTLAHCVLNTASLKTALLDAVDPVPSLSTTTITGGRLNVRKTMAGCSEPPGVPTNLVANAGNQQIRLTWSPAPNATSYRVRRSTTPGGPYTDAASNVRDVQFTNTGLTNGTTYYYVVTAMNILGESAPSVEVSATPKLPADMIVSAFSVPATAPTGGSISISLTTKNQGTGTADPSTTRFYISLNSALDAADSVIPNAAQAVPALAPGLTAAASVTITLPSTVLPGTYYVIAKADADDKVFETLETNNTYGLRISIGPDLSIWSFQPQGTGAPGATVTASYYIRNQGVEGTGASVLEIFWSANNSLDAGDTPVGRTDIGALLPNGVQSGQVPFVVPAGAAQGTYYLFAMADSSNAINESSESNNTRSASIQIGADLISRVSAPSMPGSGIPFVVTDTTTNAGTHSVGLSATRFYLSSNSTLSADDTLLGSRPVGVLEPGQASVGNTTVTIPAATTGGSYFLISQADGANAVVETNETNNTHAQALSVGPDLKVTVSSTTWPVTAGTAALVTDTVRNAGGNEAAASILRYYLSVNSWLDAGDVTLVESRSIGVLGPDASTTAQTSVTIPAGTAPGYYYLIAVADADGSVAESVEWNNTNVKLMLVK